MISYISVPKTLRYALHGNTENPKIVLYALHGYGQLVEFFIRKFTGLSPEILIVAPEGPHRFYLEGSSGRVGASWMTKVERENDIADNITYLDTLHDHIKNKHGDRPQYIVLGFSQGGATAARWVQLGKIKPDGFILWASVYPPDLPGEIIVPTEKSYFLIGDNDEFYPESSADEIITAYQEMGFQTMKYQGNHNIEPNVLRSVLEEF